MGANATKAWNERSPMGRNSSSSGWRRAAAATAARSCASSSACARAAALSVMRKDAMYIGRPLPRVEDDRFLTGRGRYTDDQSYAGAAWCAFVRSPHAHARVVRIDAARAARMAGVLAVLTGEHYAADGLQPVDHVPNPLDLHDIGRRAFDNPRQWPHWPLARDKARHVGEPLVAVVAETYDQARDAVDAVEVAYDPLPPEETLCFDYRYGDAATVSRALAGAACVARHEFHVPRIVNCQMEPRSAIGLYDGDGHTLVSGSQGAALLRD